MADRHKREQAVYQFELQAHRLGFSVLARLTNYRYVVRDVTKGTELTAVVLGNTFDFYAYRLNRGKQRADLIVVQHHDAVAPVKVISMGESREFEPGTPPALTRSTRQRRNQEEMKVFVSSLLVGSKQAAAELQTMPPRTRQRYLAMRDALLKPRVGRPFAS